MLFFRGFSDSPSEEGVVAERGVRVVRIVKRSTLVGHRDVPSGGEDSKAQTSTAPIAATLADR